MKRRGYIRDGGIVAPPSLLHTFPIGARVLVDGRDEAKIRCAFPEGSTRFLFPHYLVTFTGAPADERIAVAWGRVGVDRKAAP